MTSAQHKQEVATFRKAKRAPASEEENDTFYLKPGGSSSSKVNKHTFHTCEAMSFEP